MIRNFGRVNCPYCLNCKIALSHAQRQDPTLLFNPDGNGQPCPHLVFLIGSFYYGGHDRADLKWMCPFLDAELKKRSDRQNLHVWDTQTEMCMGGPDREGDCHGVRFALVFEPYETINENLREHDPDEQTILGANHVGAVFSIDVQQYVSAFLADVLANEPQ